MIVRIRQTLSVKSVIAILAMITVLAIEWRATLASATTIVTAVNNIDRSHWDKLVFATLLVTGLLFAGVWVLLRGLLGVLTDIATAVLYLALMLFGFAFNALLLSSVPESLIPLTMPLAILATIFLVRVVTISGLRVRRQSLEAMVAAAARSMYKTQLVKSKPNNSAQLIRVMNNARTVAAGRSDIGAAGFNNGPFVTNPNPNPNPNPERK